MIEALQCVSGLTAPLKGAHHVRLKQLNLAVLSGVDDCEDDSCLHDPDGAELMNRAHTFPEPH